MAGRRERGKIVESKGGNHRVRPVMFGLRLTD